MAKRFLTHDELFAAAAPPYATGERRLRAASLRIPYPCCFLVTLDPLTERPRATTATLGPLSWRPYTMSVNVPLSDAPTVNNLRAEGECVMAMPTRDQVREAVILSHVFPHGICATDVARLTLHRSNRVDAPSIEECPLNFECVIEYTLNYHDYCIASLRVVGASLDDTVLSWPRERVVNTFPLSFLGELVNRDGTVTPRFGMMGRIEPCPTFPVGHKRGWATRMRSWLEDLAQEEYLSPKEKETVRSWVEKYELLDLDPANEKRQMLQERISAFAEHVVWREWESLHAFLGIEDVDTAP